MRRRASEWFQTDAWLEAIESITRQGLRAGVTAVAVGWGTLMLVVLMAAGKGLQNNVEWQFRDDAINSIWVRPGETSRPWQGRAPGREIDFTNADFAALRDTVPGVEHITGRYYLWGETSVSYGEREGSFTVRACHPAHRFLERTQITSGRFIHDLDLAEQRKVTVIGERVSEFLFRGADPLGHDIDINGISYTVVGVFEDAGGDNEMRTIYVPISTAQAAYGGGDRVHHMMFTVGSASVEQSVEIADTALAMLARQHGFDPEDRKAVRMRNNLERFSEFQQIFSWIEGFVWLVGAGTLAAGVVGVGNVMLISVRERTREIGLRKALGATSGSIIGMVLREGLLLTGISGYAGLMLGVGLIEGLRRNLPENDYLRDPSVDLRVVGAATIALVIASLVASWFPAARAAAVPPIEALRDGAA